MNGWNAEYMWQSLNPAGAEVHRANVETFYEWCGPDWLSTWRDIDALDEAFDEPGMPHGR